jgi:DNA invertase Pin-like site-specific DNA recombinase
LKITPDEAKDIRARHEAGETRTQLAVDYGVHPQTIWRICNGNGKDSRAKITADQARQIKIKLANGEWGIDIAAEFGVTRGIVSDINTGKTWRWL